MSPSCIISDIKPDIGRKSRFSHNLPVFDALFEGPRRNIATTFVSEERERSSYQKLKKFENI